MAKSVLIGMRTYCCYVPSPTYLITPTLTDVSENGCFICTINTTNIPDGTVLQLAINSISGNIDSADFSQLPTSVVINGDIGTVEYCTLADFSTEGPEQLTIQLFSGGTKVAETGNITIEDTSIYLPLTLVVESYSNVTTQGGNNGVINVIGAGGKPNLEYSIDGGLTWQSSTTFSNLTFGDYTIIVRDAFGFTQSATQHINEPGVLSGTLYTNISNSSLMSMKDSSIVVSLSANVVDTNNYSNVDGTLKLYFEYTPDAGSTLTALPKTLLGTFSNLNFANISDIQTLITDLKAYLIANGFITDDTVSSTSLAGTTIGTATQLAFADMKFSFEFVENDTRQATSNTIELTYPLQPISIVNWSSKLTITNVNHANAQSMFANTTFANIMSGLNGDIVMYNTGLSGASTGSSTNFYLASAIREISFNGTKILAPSTTSMVASGTTLGAIDTFKQGYLYDKALVNGTQLISRNAKFKLLRCDPANADIFYNFGLLGVSFDWKPSDTITFVNAKAIKSNVTSYPAIAPAPVPAISSAAIFATNNGPVNIGKLVSFTKINVNNYWNAGKILEIIDIPVTW